MCSVSVTANPAIFQFIWLITFRHTVCIDITQFSFTCCISPSPAPSQKYFWTAFHLTAQVWIFDIQSYPNCMCKSSLLVPAGCVGSEPCELQVWWNHQPSLVLLIQRVHMHSDLRQYSTRTSRYGRYETRRISKFIFHVTKSRVWWAREEESGRAKMDSEKERKDVSSPQAG